MSDATDSKKSVDDPVGPGTVLRRTREARGLKVSDIAKSLHLDAWMIEALEEDDFDALGAPVFAKGHLRQYGSLIGLDTGDLMIAYYRVRGRADAPPPPITATMARPERRRGRLFWATIVAALVLIAAGLALWLIGEPTDDGSVTGATSGAASAPPGTSAPAVPAVAGTRPVAGIDNRASVTGGPAVAPIAAVPNVSDSEPVEATAADADTDVALADAGAPTDAEPVAQTMQLRMTFGGESWVEVYDADGTRLLYNMVSAGRTRTVTGRPPLEVYLGRSGLVELQVNGAPYQIPADSVRGNTARFRIGDDS